MARLPYNVLVIPFLKDKKNSNVKYCVFKREDMGIWQFVAGGGENKENPYEAAMRECMEEAGIQSDCFRELKTKGCVPSDCFSENAQESWGPNVIVIPIHCFAVEVYCPEIEISDEHIDYMWVEYDEALKLLNFDLDKTAMYETKERIERNVW